MIVVIRAGHATQRMEERGITKEDIEFVLQSCDMHLPGDNGGTCHVGLAANGKELKVWTVGPITHDGRVIVKTAAWREQK